MKKLVLAALLTSFGDFGAAAGKNQLWRLRNLSAV